jgi:hypothetical protein
MAKSTTRIRHNRKPGLAHWRTTITSLWQKSATLFIETGRALIKAERALSKTDFAALIGRPDEQGELPFSYSTARKLMQLAADRRISDFAHGRKLPACWRTLYEISQLNDTQFSYAEEKGLIRSDVERCEIENLRHFGIPQPPTVMRVAMERISSDDDDDDDDQPREVSVVVLQDSLRLDTSLPSEDVPADLQRLNNTPVEQFDRFEMLLAAWLACDEIQQNRFLVATGLMRRDGDGA